MTMSPAPIMIGILLIVVSRLSTKVSKTRCTVRVPSTGVGGSRVDDRSENRNPSLLSPPDLFVGVQAGQPLAVELQIAIHSQYKFAGFNMAGGLRRAANLEQIIDFVDRERIDSAPFGYIPSSGFDVLP
jgi:hypothetical protein